MRFEKWQALGNDYMILERDELAFELTPERVRRLCEPHLGVCADGVLLLSPASGGADVAELRIFNPDGSEAELSGNGVRQAVLYLRRRGWTERDSFSIRTPAGSVRPQITGPDTCRVDMGTAQLRSKDYPAGAADGRGELALAGIGDEPASWRFQHVSIGNPQCAIRVPDEPTLAGLDLAVLGPPIEAHELFPNRTNVSWYAELEPGRIRARIFERGAGETLSSGTGASGAAVAYALSEGEQPFANGAGIAVVLDGGELTVELDEQLRVHLSGWARPVFEGQLSPELLRELELAR
jgi:diaminopimelate epimerase